MVNDLEERIRRAAWRKELSFTAHALQRMGQKMITIDEVYECVCYGPLVETQYHGQDLKALFQEPTAGKPAKYVVVADSAPWPQVITVCLTREEVWDCINSILQRRAKP